MDLTVWMIVYLGVGILVGQLTVLATRLKPQTFSPHTTDYEQIPWYRWFSLLISLEFAWPVLFMAIFLYGLLKKSNL